MTTTTIKRAILDRLIDAWDSTVLPKSRDGMMQERMEDLRAALAAPATAPEREPITEECIKELYGDSNFDIVEPSVIALVRAIEAFHGIK